MKLSDTEIKEKLLRRLHRLEGQVHGVEAMITGERNCAEVLQQLAAIRSALDGVTEIYLRQMMEDCLLLEHTEADADSRKEMAEQLAHLVLQNR